LSEINYKFFYWGHFLLKTQIDEILRRELLDECRKAKDYFPHNLSRLDNEYTFSDQQLQKFVPRLNVYLDMYKKLYQENWNRTLEGDLRIQAMWVNFQKENEWRPPHFHSNCDASYVIYLDMPKIEPLAEGVGFQYTPGGVVFENNIKAQFSDKLKSIDSLVHLPENGDMFIFPYNLQHYSVPFKTKATRISLSGNLEIINDTNKFKENI
jgi:hypothetical protein